MSTSSRAPQKTSKKSSRSDSRKLGAGLHQEFSQTAIEVRQKRRLQRCDVIEEGPPAHAAVRQLENGHFLMLRMHEPVSRTP